ncbi:cytochrome c1, heme protein [Cardiosporidium cionae]|uniref:Cytochrome c1, heme protein n=1 Tax=Cardiosporidium cionae TaxID=476202 RepID=A0ABQ7J8B1_9APIC|nr:cytochrome c1, heme protein [Cardiosporidium cionae]|eukprot:KAF8820228.1 cytochrome c1, heme protein [Cardiosporidium cionae]
MAGGGDALQKLFVGYTDKLWLQLRPQWRRYMIQRWNKQFEKQWYSLCVASNNRMRWFFKNIVDPLRPSDKYRTPVTDYKRQKARGTLVEGVDYYIADRHVQTRLERPFEPFSEEEVKERSKYRYQSLKYYLAFALGATALHGILQSRPVAWCMEKPPPHAPNQPFWFKSIFHSHDVPSLRRGYEVYRKVCASCHSMELIQFRHLVNEILPEKRMKQIAASYDFTDGPNEEGEMYTRPGTLPDHFPKPYPNEEAARYANGGANPPDLSVISAARHNGPDYVYALLTGYREPPEGIELRGGLYYNTYFPGGAIAMPPPLMDDMIDYEDGTPNNISQMAKDVVNFMTWATEPTHDERKLEGLKAVSAAFMGVIFMTVWFRFYWTMFGTRRIDFGKLKYL